MKPVVDLKTQDHRRLSLRKTVANLGFEKSFTGGQGPFGGDSGKDFMVHLQKMLAVKEIIWDYRMLGV